jgi:hypothetical protein
MDQAPWWGMRWQVSFTPGGQAVPWPVDATTTDEGHRQALTVQARLRAAGGPSTSSRTSATGSRPPAWPVTSGRRSRT